MRNLRWLLLLACFGSLAWAFLASGETPKKGKSAAKKSAKTVDLENLPAAERRALMLDRMSEDQRKKAAEKQTEERATALKQATTLERELKTADEDDKPRILFGIGVASLHAGNAAQALRYFQQAAASTGEWSARARIHQFDLLLYDKRDLAAARDVLKVESTGESSERPPILLAPRTTAEFPLAPQSIAANLAARAVLVEFLDGRAQSFPAGTSGSSVWSALSRWNPEYPEVVDEESDASWLIRLAELHFAAADHATATSLFDFVAASRSLHPSKRQKSFACFRRAQSAYQLHAALLPSERGVKEIVADYALAVKIDKDAPWAGEALFLQGNVVWNQLQDDGAAIKIWKDVLARYPQSRFAENAGYNIGVLYQLYGEKSKAKAAFADFRERYPKSNFLAGLNDEGLVAHIKPIQRPQ